MSADRPTYMWEILNVQHARVLTPEQRRAKIELERRQVEGLTELINSPISEVFPPKKEKPPTP